jgi:bisphosphoglycerate-dependent phosphoglycerate mutase
MVLALPVLPVTALYGGTLIKIWRHLYTALPSALELTDELRHPQFDRDYAALNVKSLRAAELLRNTQ